MSDQLDWNLLDRYFSGGASPDEAAAVEEWVRAEVGRADELNTVRAIWHEAGTARSRFDVRAAKATLHRRMAEPIRASAPARVPRFVFPQGKRRRWAMAAGIAALLAGATVWQVARSPFAMSELATTHQYRTSPGERSQFHLPDGTQVMLGPASRLSVATTYGTEAREVRLEGQGYFDVVHDERRPFAVQAGGAVVRDLGTQFDVRAYPADRRVRVVVAEGEAALDAQPLTPGQMGVRAADGSITVQTDVDVARYLAWTNGELVFEETPLAEAIPELNRWYNLQFQLADSSLVRFPLTGTLKDRPNAETFDLLALLLGVPVERQGNRVVIGVSRS